MEEDTNILKYEFVFHVVFQVFITCVLIFFEYFVFFCSCSSDPDFNSVTRSVASHQTHFETNPSVHLT